tara:strand:+ start:1258 stop:1770 length:513 start_codon:yes stop_codon:yes gene_type:complete
VIKQDISENRANCIYLGLGSNLGNKKRNIENAKYRLIQNNIEILKSSNFYESFSWPNERNPKFLNIVLKISTNYHPLELLKVCKNIENELGRKKTVRNAPRTCDIDILDYGNIKSKDNIILPHPRMHERSFVLLPLFEISKNWSHPILKVDIKTLISLLSSRDISSIKQI